MNKKQETMKRKIILLATIAITSIESHAQDARGAMNQILSDYTLPLFAAIMLAGIALGLVQQWDNIIDKDNRGTRKDGLMALGWYVGFALLAAIVISAVQRELTGIRLTI